MEKKKLYQRPWVLVLSILVILIIVGAASSGGKTTTTIQTASGVVVVKTETMSMEEFTKIKSGMTYEEVTGIIGGPGEIISEYGTPEDDFYSVSYQYKGDGTLGANANLMFQGGKLINKAQYGLK